MTDKYMEFYILDSVYVYKKVNNRWRGRCVFLNPIGIKYSVWVTITSIPSRKTCIPVRSRLVTEMYLEYFA